MAEDKGFVLTLCDSQTFWMTADGCTRIVV